MQQTELTQGSQEWLAHRAKHFNASDCPAMMGVSSYKTRNQLLHELYTGLHAEVDANTQERFDIGHKFEALARPLAEKIIGDDLYAVVGVAGKLSASFDGITILEDTIWEHKTLNERIEQSFSNFTDLHFDCGAYHPSYNPVHEIPHPLPEEYQVQMEHQLIVSGASRCLFTASKWANGGNPNDDGEIVLEKALHCWYESNESLRERILQGWDQFSADLKNYVPKSEPTPVQPIGRTPENLPALYITVSGSVTASNLQEVKAHVFDVFAGFSRELSTDQDFADAEKTIKWCKSVEAKLKASKEHAQGQMSSVDELFRTIDDISNEARRLRLDYEKLVEARKSELRESVVLRGRDAYAKYADVINEQIAPCVLPLSMPDFAGAIKGKRTIESIQNAVDTAVANQKIAADSAAERIKANLAVVRNAGNDLLFADIAALCLKDKEFVAMTVKQRLADHKAAQDARAELEAQEKRVEQAPVQEEIQLSPTTSTQHDDGKRITLGNVCSRLGITMTSEFVKTTLGINPIEIERASKLYTEAQFQQICCALAQHVSSVQAHHNDQI